MKKYTIIYLASCLFLILLTSHFQLLAQEKLFLINSREVIKKGMEFHESEKYKEAIEQFNLVSENDTNYLWAMYEKALSARVDSQYQFALTTSQTALKVKPNEFEHDLLIQIGSIYDEMKKYDSAAIYFKKAIERFPNSYLAYHSRGINFYVMKEYDSAFAYFEKAILMNPYAHNSHYFLGVIAMERGYPIHAMMSFTMSLMIAPGSPRVNQIIKYMYQISQLSDDVVGFYNNRKEEKFIKEDYSEIETFFKAKLALDKKYSIQTDLNEPLFRQLNLIFDKMPSTIQHQDDIWSAFYAPIYRMAYDQKYFNAITLIMVSGLQNASAQKLVKENKKAIDKAADEISKRLDEVGYHRSYDRTTYKDGPGYWFADSRPVSKGILLNKDKNMPDGEWLYFNNMGNVSKIINYKAGKYEGLYRTFFYNGVVSSEGNFVNDKLLGEVKEYFIDGTLKVRSHMQDGKKEGLYEEFVANGAPSIVNMYKEGKREGPASVYYLSGCKQYDVTYQNDKLEGEIKEYFKQGSLYAVTGVVNDKAEGSKKEYFPNGLRQGEGTMHEGLKEGLYTSYFNDGITVSSKVNYKKGKLDGLCTYYHRNGKVRTEITYADGDQEGESTTKDEEGRLVAVDFYKKGHLKWIKYYNVLNGQLVKENIIDDKDKNTIMIYNKTGNKNIEAVCNRDGIYNGEYKDYYLDGKIRTKKNYERGNANGAAFEYFKNGNIYREENYKDDELDGSFKQYYKNGKLDLEGMYVNGQREGYWYNYDNAGTLVSKDYYLNNKRDGLCYSYWGSGKLRNILYHADGHETRYIEYDTTGKVINDIEYVMGKTTVLSQKNGIGMKRRVANVLYNELVGADIEYYPNGQKESESYYKFGYLDSTFTSYFSNGKINKKGQYLNDEKEGVWKTYTREGRLASIEHYENGEETSTDSLYSEANVLETTVDYQSGDRHGWLKQYGAKNELMYMFHYIDNLIVGYTYQAADGSLVKEIPVENSEKLVPLNAFYKDGKRSLEGYYQNGSYQGKRTLYYPNDKVYYEVSYKDGKSDGDEKEFYSNGQLNYVHHYQDGELVGLQQKYNEKGVLLKEENYNNGYQHGTTKIYDDNGKLIQTNTYYWGELLQIN